MRRETEKIGNLFQLFLSEFQDDFEDEEAALEVFTNLYNEGRLEDLTNSNPAEEAYSLLDEAMQTSDQVPYTFTKPLEIT